MNSSPTKTCLIKVGGSLLAEPELPTRLTHFMTERPQDRMIVIVGGGTWVDSLRSWRQVHNLPEAHSNEFFHWTAIRLMSETARLLNRLLPELPIIDSIDSINCNCILDCNDFMRSESGLERSWQTTSDSIAAEVARYISAEQLWLFKSILPESPEVTSWSHGGIVDQSFQKAIRSNPTTDPDKALEVFIVNARDDNLLSVRGV